MAGTVSIASIQTSAAETWTFCANEQDLCRFSGVAQLRYGANGTYCTKTFVTSTPCTDSVFGDPLPGVVKRCEYLASTGGTSGGSGRSKPVVMTTTSTTAPITVSPRA